MHIYTSLTMTLSNRLFRDADEQPLNSASCDNDSLLGNKMLFTRENALFIRRTFNTFL